MTIIEALKSEDFDIVVKNGKRTLFWELGFQNWIVTESHRSKVTKYLETESEEEAVNELLK